MEAGEHLSHFGALTDRSANSAGSPHRQRLRRGFAGPEHIFAVRLAVLRGDGAEHARQLLEARHGAGIAPAIVGAERVDQSLADEFAVRLLAGHAVFVNRVALDPHEIVDIGRTAVLLGDVGIVPDAFEQERLRVGNERDIVDLIVMIQRAALLCTAQTLCSSSSLQSMQ